MLQPSKIQNFSFTVLIFKNRKYNMESMKKEKGYQILHQNYRELIEFINDSSFSPTFYIIQFFLPSITIFADLISNISQSSILSNIANLSFTNLVAKLIMSSSWIYLILKILLLFTLMVPFLMVLILALVTLRYLNSEHISISHFYTLYSNWALFRWFRFYFAIFQRVFFPVVVSLGIKIALKMPDPTFGAIVLTFSIISSLTFHYFSFEIPSSKGFLQQKSINFPNSITESIFIFISLIVINATSGVVPFISCLCFFILRTITSHFLRFETEHYYPSYILSLFCANSFSVALLIGYLNNQFNIMCFCAIITIIMIFAIKGEIQDQGNYFEVYTKDEQENIQSVDNLKKYLKEEKIAKVFTQAVLMSRKKNSHREEIMLDILKRKCYSLEVESRGSTKMANSLLLLEYEKRVVSIVKKTLSIKGKAMETLSIMKIKEPKQEIFIRQVVGLVNQIDENKKEFLKCLQVNSVSTQLIFLMHLFFRQLYNDCVFIREINSKFRDEIHQINHRRIQKQLFTKQVSLIVVNVLDEVGKITKVSKNIPHVLGYTAYNLIGLSINELIPFTIRSIHDDILRKFVSTFTSDVLREKHSVQFYAYDKNFHLQKVSVKYKFFLHNFEICELSSIVRKLKTEQYVILTDEYGNIEGWTSSIGQLFNFDELIGNNCNSYNFLPLIPAAIKYEKEKQLSYNTIIFRLSKMKNSKLMIYDPKRDNHAKPQQVKERQIETFKILMEKGQIIEAFYFNLQVKNKYLHQYKKMLRIFYLTDLKRIDNFQKLQGCILNNQIQESKQKPNAFDFNVGLFPDKSMEDSSDAQFSIFKNNEKNSESCDFNFSLDLGRPNFFQYSKLQFNREIERMQSLVSTRSLVKIDVQDDAEQAKYMNGNLTIQSNFDPQLERKNSFLWIIILMTIGLITLLIQDQVTLANSLKIIKSKENQILHGNRAEMIYCKTVFNPNKTYIEEFNEGKLFVKNSLLKNENFSYFNEYGDSMEQNMFYTLNIQIPSVVSRVLREQSQNQQSHQPQYQYNFLNVINLYEKFYELSKQSSSSYLQSIKTQCNYKMAGYCLGAIIYFIFLLKMQHRFKNQRKMVEAFFKFERQDLDKKISNINTIGILLQKKCQSWFIDDLINETNKKKGKDKRSNDMQINTQNSIKKQGLKTNNTEQDFGFKKNLLKQEKEQSKLSKKRFYNIIIIIVIFLILQLLFLVLQGVLTQKTLSSFKDALLQYNQANKLVVYPNLAIASKYFPVSPDILNKYQKSVENVLNTQNQYMPSLFNLFSEKPCQNCNFLRETMNTNYRSFYSFFTQTIASSNKTSLNLEEIFYAVDVVVENISIYLVTEQAPNLGPIAIIYIFSLIFFYISVVTVSKQLDEEYEKLECFLKFFDTETLVKNKHMSTILAKNM